MSALILAIPSKGRLQEKAFAHFSDAGLAVLQDGGQRGYVARLTGRSDVEVRLLSAGDIALALRDGVVHAGVTGEDLLREVDGALSVARPIVPLGFGRADLVVAAPAAWVDVTTMEDLDEVSETLRARTGRRLRVATKYVHQAHRYFSSRGLDDYRIVESVGATEGAPAAGVADVIVDITTTGATLAANHLRPLADGPILRSQAHIAISRAAAWSEPARSAIRNVLDQLEARERGRNLKLVRVAVGRAGIDQLRALASRMGARADGDAAVASSADAAFYLPANRAAEFSAEASARGAGPLGIFACEHVFDIANQWSAAALKAISAEPISQQR